MISGAEQPAQSGNTEQLVIILHGWGADGVNLIDLARPWGIAMPDAHFCAPNAPHVCEANPMGFQWFSLADRSPDQLIAGVEDAAAYVNEFIDAKLAETGASTLALAGFSQGTMTALHVGLRRDDVKCILGYSGALLASENIVDEITNKPPICLVHGEEDDVVPFASMAHAEATLKECGVDIETHARPNLPHSIDMEGVEIGGKFLLEKLD